MKKNKDKVLFLTWWYSTMAELDKDEVARRKRGIYDYFPELTKKQLKKKLKKLKKITNKDTFKLQKKCLLKIKNNSTTPGR